MQQAAKKFSQNLFATFGYITKLNPKKQTLRRSRSVQPGNYVQNLFSGTAESALRYRRIILFHRKEREDQRREVIDSNFLGKFDWVDRQFCF